MYPCVNKRVRYNDNTRYYLKSLTDNLNETRFCGMVSQLNVNNHQLKIEVVFIMLLFTS
jgi:hypothetical protein